jgi:ABC-type lipoprotein release transport system permease subunit
VRLALGAPPSSIARDLVLGAMRALSWGLAAGAPVALVVLGRLGREIGPELQSRPWPWLGIPLALTVATLLAALAPARRAARIDVARVLTQA